MPAVNFGFSAVHSTCQIKGYKVFCVYQRYCSATSRATKKIVTSHINFSAGTSRIWSLHWE